MSIERLHRIGHLCYKKKIPLISFLCKLLIRVIFNSAVDPSTQIGKGTIFGYGGIAIVIHKRAVIGENCVIGSCVTVGGRNHDNVPVIGDNVKIHTGAKVLGNITIGNNVEVGANAVVIESVQDNAIVAGVPAKVKRIVI